MLTKPIVVLFHNVCKSNIMLCTLNLYSNIGQLFPNITGKNPLYMFYQYKIILLNYFTQNNLTLLTEDIFV